MGGGLSVLGPPLSGGGMVGFGEGGFSESRKSAGLWWNEEARGKSIGGAANHFSMSRLCGLTCNYDKTDR